MSHIVWQDAGVYTPTACDLEDVARGLQLSRFSERTTTFAIRNSVLTEIRAHTGAHAVEVGGLLVGEAYVDCFTGAYLVDVMGSLPAIGAHGTGTYFRFTPDAWDYISRVRAERFPELVTVGWYHSHPGLGVFYSSTDRASQRAFFHYPWNVGLVIDPRSGEIGAFVGRESDRCDDCLVPYSSPDVNQPPVITSPPGVSLPSGDRRRWAVVACGAGIGGLMVAMLNSRNRRKR